MKLSWNWLKTRIDLQGLTPEILADKLTFAGAEVEGIERLAQGNNLVIGHILSCVAHPDSDHLHVLQVDEGPVHGVHQIVCGAPNAREGINVIVARVGAKLPQVEIKASSIRGVESDGMCCALYELGVDKKFLTEYQCSGIEELPADAPIGEENVLGYLGLDDVVLEVSVLPNRPDLYALENVAKEVGCLLNLPVKPEELASPKLEKASIAVGSDTPKCPLFSGRLVKGVVTKESPAWMKEALTAAGIRSINSVVDIGNYVMLVTGQPLNMYDADKLPEASLIVKDDMELDFLAMDGQTYSIVPGDLVVTSGNKPMCLAGIMTADACRVDENSTNIIVEAAYFAYASIRHTSNRIGLSSDSSLRFCKGINPHQAEYVQNLTTKLLLDLCDAKEVEETALYDTFDHSPKIVKTSLSYLNGRLGTSFDEETVLATLTRDHFEVLSSENGNYEIKVPAYRIDVDGEADLAEELIRILGYEHVHSVLPITELTLAGLTPKQSLERSIRRHLLSCGVSQILTYTLISEEETKLFSYVNKSQAYLLKNPMTVERAAVRTNVLHSVLSAVSYNVARKNDNLAFFEVSDIDSPSYTGRHLAVVLSGNKMEQGRLGERAYDFYDMKGLFEGIMAILGLIPSRYNLVRYDEKGEEMHPGRSVAIKMGKKPLGFFGELHPKALEKYGLKNAIVMELDLDALTGMKTSPIKSSIPPRFPSVTRDLAFTVSDNVAYEDIRKELIRCDALIKGVEVFDVYTGSHVAANKKSIAISLTLLDPERTLRDEEIAVSMKKALSTLEVKFGAEIRG